MTNVSFCLYENKWPQHKKKVSGFHTYFTLIMCKVLKKSKRGLLRRSDERKKGYPCPIPWMNKYFFVTGMVLHFPSYP